MDRSLRIYFSSIKHTFFAILIFIILWWILSLIYPPYIIPKPLYVLKNIDKYFEKDFYHHFIISIYRTFAGFFISLIAGTILSLITHSSKIQSTFSIFLALFQVIPGTILGIIFLLLSGIGSATPIAMVASLTISTVFINATNVLLKSNKALESVIIVNGGKKKDIVKYVLLPALVPITRSNLTLGMGLGLKVVVLGEFIGSQNGIGYLLNVARIYFQMDRVFFYLIIFLLFMVLYEFIVNMVFILFFTKYLYPE
ncbi:MAG: ABC transporter permease [Exilispira sp.]